MARKSRMSMLKRQRERAKAEKAAEKRARRQGKSLERPAEPKQTVDLSAITDSGEKPDPSAEDEPSDSDD